MSNEEFLVQLERLLRDKMPLLELQNVMEYHREYFAEAGENAAAELDQPEVIAQRILNEYFSPPVRRSHGWIRPAVLVIWLIVLMVGVSVRLLPRYNAYKETKAPVLKTGDNIAETIEQITVTDALAPGSFGANVSLPEFQSIVLEGVLSHVTVVSDARNECILELYDGAREAVECSVDNGVLHIVGAGKRSSASGDIVGRILLRIPVRTELSRVNVQIDRGDITWENINAKEVELDTDVGDISVSGGIYGALDCETAMGDVTVTDVEAKSLSCSSDCGNIDLVECTAGDTSLEVDMGNIIAVFNGVETDYALALETDMGEIKINGQDVSQTYKTIQGKRAYKLEAETDVGSIYIDFTQN